MKFIIKSWAWDLRVIPARNLRVVYWKPEKGFWTPNLREAKRFNSAPEARRALEEVKAGFFDDQKTHVWPLRLERKRR